MSPNSHNLRCFVEPFEDASAVVTINPLLNFKEFFSSSIGQVDSYKTDRIRLATLESDTVELLERCSNLVGDIQEVFELDALRLSAVGYDAVDKEMIVEYMRKYQSLFEEFKVFSGETASYLKKIHEDFLLFSEKTRALVLEHRKEVEKTRIALDRILAHLGFYLESFEILNKEGLIDPDGYLYLHAKTFQMMSFLLDDVPIEFGGDIGKGGNARVLKATQEELEFAAKVPLLPEIEHEVENFKREVAISLLFCPEHHVLTPLLINMSTPVVFFDLAVSDLYSIYNEDTKLLDVDRLLHSIKDIAKGLQDLESKNVVHEDLKPGNVLLLQGGKAMISDFGLARRSGTVEGLGTPGFEAPETLKKVPKDSKADIFSLGASVYYLLTGNTFSFDIVKKSVQKKLGKVNGQRKLEQMQRNGGIRALQLQYMQTQYSDKDLELHLRNLAKMPLNRLGGERPQKLLMQILWNSLRCNPKDRCSSKAIELFVSRYLEGVSSKK